MASDCAIAFEANRKRPKTRASGYFREFIDSFFGMRRRSPRDEQ
jgi:hypothetical protein